jgi:nucleoside-diphosphate-sugar epimerase
VKILITGNMGYVGPTVVEWLLATNPEAKIIGLDMGYFAHCLAGVKMLPECRIHKQYFADVRNISEDIFNGVYGVVHLAAISNDPMGNFFTEPTFQINAQATVEIGRIAKKAGVRSFVYASSCSIYGAATDGARTESAPLNPLTAYARSKVYSERELEKIADEKFIVTSLRFSTACGMSERLRLDLVLNDFVASAVALKRITVLSDGTPWRPLIHVKDMARAIDWGLSRQSDPTNRFLAVNVGRDDWNYQVRDLAEAVADIIPGLEVSINKKAQPDRRSYKVSFRLFKSLAPEYQPQYDLNETVVELKEGLEEIYLHNPDFQSSSLTRLKILKSYVDNGILDSDLNWVRN